MIGQDSHFCLHNVVVNNEHADMEYYYFFLHTQPIRKNFQSRFAWDKFGSIFI